METFVVRIWVPAAGGGEPEAGALRGVVEHVTSATSVTFAGADELVACLRGRLGRAGTSTRTTGGTAG